jgi:Ferritin-like domain
MVSAARLFENVGVGAYLGAAHLVQDVRVLTDAATIVTIEARHQTVLNLFQAVTAIPQAFDIPLLPQEVLAIAGSFISGCSLGIQGAFSQLRPFLMELNANFLPRCLANAPLSVTNTGAITVGTSLQFSSPALNGSTSVSPSKHVFQGMHNSPPLVHRASSARC